MEQYRHTQVGWVLVGVFAVLALSVSPGLAAAGLAGGLLAAGAVAVLVLLLFATLTVAIDAVAIQIRMGIGLVRKRYPLAALRTFRVVRNPWYYGWGIRRIPGGWMFNVSGLSAVELRLADGRLVRIGTDEPEALQAALVRAAGTPAPLTAEETGRDERRLRRSATIAGVATAAVAAVVAVLLYAQSRPPVTSVTGQEFSVASGLYAARVPLAQIVSLTLEPELPRVLRRTNGFAMGATLRGHFRLERLGGGQLFVRRDRPPFILVRTRDSFVAVNFREPERTLDLYAALRERLRARSAEGEGP